MLPLVAIPDLVQHDAPVFAAVFSPEALQQFQRDIRGLIGSANKTVDGIHRLFVLDVRHHRSLNRLFTERPCAVGPFNPARRAVWQSLPGPQRKPKGVLALDETLFTHDGTHVENLADLYDATPNGYVGAHQLVQRHYRAARTDSPVDFRLWEPAELAA
jgi:DDE superfamily endonuclease